LDQSQLSSVAVKVLVADDHAIFRQGLRVVLGELDPAVDIVEAGDFGEALTIARSAHDLSLLLADLRMPEMDSFEGIRALRRVLPRVPIMVLSASEDAADLFGALESGASGYLPKSAPASVILEALRLILAGGVYVPRELLSGGRPLPQPTATSDRGDVLTPRQHEVLALIADGHSNKEIAYRIGTSEGTVKAHITAIMRVLGVRNRVQLLLAAEQRGIRPRPGG
jgi:DNA-binding NarL/FixJ family response regulator